MDFFSLLLLLLRLLLHRLFVFFSIISSFFFFSIRVYTLQLIILIDVRSFSLCADVFFRVSVLLLLQVVLRPIAVITKKVVLKQADSQFLLLLLLKLLVFFCWVNRTWREIVKVIYHSRIKKIPCRNEEIYHLCINISVWHQTEINIDKEKNKIFLNNHHFLHSSRLPVPYRSLSY